MKRETYLTAGAPVQRLTIDARVTAADQDGRKITGRILTFGETGYTSAGPTRFKAGSLQQDADLSGVKLLVNHDDERVVGYADSITAAGDDLIATFSVAPGDMGDEVLASAAGKLRDGLSVGVQIIDAAVGTDGVLEVTAGWLREVSAVAIPAFGTAKVSSVAASQQRPQSPAPAGNAMVAAPAPAYQPTRTQARGKSLDQTIRAMTGAYLQGGPDALMRAALADIVMPTDAGQADTMFRPQWLGELWDASETGRPFIDAFGGPRPLTSWKVQGFRRTRNGVVDEYAGNKAEIPTGPGNPLEPVENTAKRQAGGNDIDRVFFDFGMESFLSNYLAVQTDTYRENVNSLFAADVLAAATALPASATALAALKLVARSLPKGSSLNVVLVAADVWASLLDINSLDAPWLFGGNSSLTEQGGTIGGVTFTTDDAIPDGTVLGADRRAAQFYEWRNPPLAIQAVNLPQAGVDVAVYGYWSDLIVDPDAIVTTTVSAGGEG